MPLNAEGGMITDVYLKLSPFNHSEESQRKAFLKRLKGKDPDGYIQLKYKLKDNEIL